MLQHSSIHHPGLRRFRSGLRAAATVAAAICVLTLSSPANAGGTNGACCFLGGPFCAEETRSECEARETGSYAGDFTSCSDTDICVAACCTTSGCTEVDPLVCYSINGFEFGHYQGAGSSCETPGICAAPTEACCDPRTPNRGGTGLDCMDLTPSDCENAFGRSQGPDTACTDTDICVAPTTTTTSTTLPPTEACCTSAVRAPGLYCFDATPAQCVGPFEGTPQGPGTSCVGNPGICSVATSSSTTSTTTTTTTTSTTTSTTLGIVCGNGVVEAGEGCDDGNTDTGDGCDGTCQVEQCWTCGGDPCCGRGDCPRRCRQVGASVCTPVVDGTPCDDGEICTRNDQCTTGTCGGSLPVIGAACQWVIVGGDPTAQVKTRTGGASEVIGDICASRVALGKNAVSTSNVAGTRDSGKKVIGIAVGPDTLVTGTVATGGGGIKATPGTALLPGLTEGEVLGGNTLTSPGGQLFDATGANELVAECVSAQAAIDTASAAIEAATSTADLGSQQIQTSLTIAPGSPAGVTAGAVNVIDFTDIRARKGAQLILDGGGDANTAYVLRVRGPGSKAARGKISFLAQGEVVLQNGLTAANVIFYNGGKRGCRFGNRAVGFGTVLCPDSVVKLGGAEGADWSGVLLGGRGVVKIGEKGNLTHVAPSGVVTLP